MEALTDADGSAVCLNERPLCHVIDTWLTGLVEVFLFNERKHVLNCTGQTEGLLASRQKSY